MVLCEEEGEDGERREEVQVKRKRERKNQRKRSKNQWRIKEWRRHCEYFTLGDLCQLFYSSSLLLLLLLRYIFLCFSAHSLDTQIYSLMASCNDVTSGPVANSLRQNVYRSRAKEKHTLSHNTHTHTYKYKEHK